MEPEVSTGFLLSQNMDICGGCVKRGDAPTCLAVTAVLNIAVAKISHRIWH